MREIRILPAVLQDVAEAAEWYDEEKHRGLGERFLDAFYASLLHIQQDGEIYREAYQDFRKILIRPFPYSVYYRLHANIWIVTLSSMLAENPLWHGLYCETEYSPNRRMGLIPMPAALLSCLLLPLRG